MEKNENNNSLLIKLSAKKEEALEVSLKKLAEMQDEAEFMATQIDKIDGEKESIETENAELTDENEFLAQQIAEKIEEVVDKSTDPVTTEAIPEDKKDALIDVVGRALDEELAGSLSDAIDVAEDDGAFDGSKLASIMTGLLTSYASRADNKPMGDFITKKANKTLTGGSVEAKFYDKATTILDNLGL